MSELSIREQIEEEERGERARREPESLDTRSFVPNLDDCDSEELHELRKAFTDLAKYCSKKQLARTYRETGNIQAALQYEAACQAIYENLPKDFKW